MGVCRLAPGRFLGGNHALPPGIDASASPTAIFSAAWRCAAAAEVVASTLLDQLLEATAVPTVGRQLEICGNIEPQVSQICCSVRWIDGT
jgi:hypothetical protein